MANYKNQHSAKSKIKKHKRPEKDYLAIYTDGTRKQIKARCETLARAVARLFGNIQEMRVV